MDDVRRIFLNEILEIVEEDMDLVDPFISESEISGPPPLMKELIDAIPYNVITQEHVDAKLQCSICMNDFVVDEQVKKLVCGHFYHQECIRPWLELHATCPICRMNLYSAGDSVTQNESTVLQEFRDRLMRLNRSTSRIDTVIDTEPSSSGVFLVSSSSSGMTSSSCETYSLNVESSSCDISCVIPTTSSIANEDEDVSSSLLGDTTGSSSESS